MSETSKLIAEIKSEGILRAGDKLEQLYSLATELESDHAALQQKLDALAAENAALKCKKLIGYVKDADIADVANGRVASLMPNDVFGEKPVYLSVETPATDAYLNSVRAEGVDLVKSHPAVSLVSLTHICDQIAEQLRSGTHDTAKEGE
ncbi:hypothetical protein [Pantoea ananatis]|uniref:hypothetical protein n=1 Tax=Pantoea ananas TaxID=553 RepID=UPI001B30D0F2|nr:hypothetical protein [Pantoea ananatis]